MVVKPEEIIDEEQIILQVKKAIVEIDNKLRNDWRISQTVRFDIPENLSLCASMIKELYERAGWSVVEHKGDSQKDGPWHFLEFRGNRSIRQSLTEKFVDMLSRDAWPETPACGSEKPSLEFKGKKIVVPGTYTEVDASSLTAKEIGLKATQDEKPMSLFRGGLSWFLTAQAVYNAAHHMTRESAIAAIEKAFQTAVNHHTAEKQDFGPPIDAEFYPCDGILHEVRRERIRQVDEEGFDAAHDDKHTRRQIAQAAAAYAVWPVIAPWPWDDVWDRRDTHPYRKRLVIAAALLVAEIERLDRRGDE